MTRPICPSAPNDPVEAIAMRNVTEVRTMPRGRKPEGEQALSNAERQARYRARPLAPVSPVATRPRRTTDRRSRLNDGVTQSMNCCRYRPPMPIGSRLSPIVCKSVRPPRPWKPSSSSTSPTWLASNHPAATAGISNANEKSDATHPSSADHERI